MQQQGALSSVTCRDPGVSQRAGCSSRRARPQGGERSVPTALSLSMQREAIIDHGGQTSGRRRRSRDDDEEKGETTERRTSLILFFFCSSSWWSFLTQSRDPTAPRDDGWRTQRRIEGGRRDQQPRTSERAEQSRAEQLSERKLNKARAADELNEGRLRWVFSWPVAEDEARRLALAAN